MEQQPMTWKGTTILSVRKGADVVIAGDGQVTFGNTVMKSNAKKVRRLGNGDVLEPEDGIVGIGSGGSYALAAARALSDTDMTAEEIALKSMQIAADICIYTNHNIIVEKI